MDIDNVVLITKIRTIDMNRAQLASWNMFDLLDGRPCQYYNTDCYLSCYLIYFLFFLCVVYPILDFVGYVHQNFDFDYYIILNSRTIRGVKYSPSAPNHLKLGARGHSNMKSGTNINVNIELVSEEAMYKDPMVNLHLDLIVN